MITINELSKRYKKNYAVKKLSFKVNKGEVFGLLGCNGAGKTTTMKMILGLSKPSNGSIEINEDSKISYSPETPYFHSFLTAYEIMRFFSKLQKLKKKDSEEEITRILKRVDLWDVRNRKVKKYSKGMTQRLAIAQALLGNPDILILDEPTSGLDAIGRIKILDLIKELKKDGKTIILNSHILDDVQKVADRGIIIHKGKLIKEWDLKLEEQHQSLEDTLINILKEIN